jgi:hypothetical protein
MMSARTIWLCWCLGWAAFWFFVGLGTLGLGFILTAGSVAAFWIPVGKVPPLPPLPPGWRPPPPIERWEDRR